MLQQNFVKIEQVEEKIDGNVKSKFYYNASHQGEVSKRSLEVTGRSLGVSGSILGILGAKESVWEAKESVREANGCV